jgi:hypothetical protein
MMAAKLDYHRHLRKVMADPGMFLLAPLKERGVTLSSSQVYRLVAERPERLKILMALLDILDCTMDDLIEPIATAGQRYAADVSRRTSPRHPIHEAGATT